MSFSACFVSCVRAVRVVRVVCVVRVVRVVCVCVCMCVCVLVCMSCLCMSVCMCSCSVWTMSVNESVHTTLPQRRPAEPRTNDVTPRTNDVTHITRGHKSGRLSPHRPQQTRIQMRASRRYHGVGHQARATSSTINKHGLTDDHQTAHTTGRRATFPSRSEPRHPSPNCPRSYSPFSTSCAGSGTRS